MLKIVKKQMTTLSFVDKMKTVSFQIECLLFEKVTKKNIEQLREYLRLVCSQAVTTKSYF